MKKISVLIISMLIVSCSKPIEKGNPVSVELIYPQNNSICLEGSIVNSTYSQVSFEWGDSTDNDIYSLHVQPLSDETLDSKSQDGLVSSEYTFSLKRGVYYEWYVISKVEGVDQTAESEHFQFYLFSEPFENYSPFPANLIKPNNESELASGSIEFSWASDDPDGDELDFEFQLNNTDNFSSELLYQEQLSIPNITKSLEAGTYYWRVISSDGKSKSTSSIFSFKIN